MFVYKITNLVDNKIYIGITTRTVQERFSEHYAHRKERQHLHLYQAMIKYGKDNFKVETIDIAETLEELYEKERYWIKYYNSNNHKFGYNNTEGGDKTFNYLDLNKEEVIKLYFKLKSSTEVAKILNVSPNTILRRLHSWGIKTNEAKPEELIIQDYLIPMSTKDLMIKYDIKDKRTIWKILNSHNILRHEIKQTMFNSDDIIQDYKNGLDIKTLSKKYGYWESEIKKLIKYKFKI